MKASLITPESPQEHQHLSRRDVLGKALRFGAAAVAATALGATGAIGRAAAATTFRTTVALNLREGPGTSYKVLLVMPAGATVTDYDGKLVNGFRSVDYKGTVGWASNQYLTTSHQAPPQPGPVIGVGVTTVALNLRSGPSTGDKVLRVMAKGSLVEITNTIKNGFRYVYHQGLGGWAADQYLAPYGGEHPGTGTVTVNLNLRAEPNTNAKVLLVIPAGATVRWTDWVMNGFREVIYNGVRGWAWDAYIKK